MEALISALANPGEMTDQQWTMLGIMVVVVAGSLYFVRRFYKLASKMRKQPYKPILSGRAQKAGRPGAPRPGNDDTRS
jgi:hypothetical protein